MKKSTRRAVEIFVRYARASLSLPPYGMAYRPTAHRPSSLLKPDIIYQPCQRRRPSFSKGPRIFSRSEDSISSTPAMALDFCSTRLSSIENANAPRNSMLVGQHLESMSSIRRENCKGIEMERRARDRKGEMRPGGERRAFALQPPLLTSGPMPSSALNPPLMSILRPTPPTATPHFEDLQQAIMARNLQQNRCAALFSLSPLSSQLLHAALVLALSPALSPPSTTSIIALEEKTQDNVKMTNDGDLFQPRHVVRGRIQDWAH